MQENLTAAALAGAALDLAVAQVDPRCVGLRWEVRDGVTMGICTEDDLAGLPACFICEPGYLRELKIKRKFGKELTRYSPSSNWTDGGFLIEKEKITTIYTPLSGHWSAYWNAVTTREALSRKQDGPTALVAAMRCYVTSQAQVVQP
jgi:hypothetical protein